MSDEATNPQLEPVRRAVEWTLERHAPWPGFAVDRLWRIVRFNEPGRRLFEQVGLHEGDSVLAFLDSPAAPGLIENWPEVAHQAVLRLRTESTAQGGVPELEQVARRLAQVPTPAKPVDQPVIVTRFRLGHLRLGLFATIGQFGSPEDLTLDDLKLELFFPADQVSEQVLRALTTGRRSSARKVPRAR